MAYTGTITTEAEIALMSGENVDATGATEANNNLLVAHAEGFLSGLIQDDVVAGFAGYDTVTKQLLSEWAARYAGMTLIMYNTAGYSDLIEAEDMVQVHVYRMEQIQEQLSKGEVQKQLKVNT
jgi:hypothetical protein